jgi:hypothetical protein
MKKIGLLLMALVVAIGGLGVGYAMWEDSVYMFGTVETGNVCVIFDGACTDDPCCDDGEPSNTILADPDRPDCYSTDPMYETPRCGFPGDLWVPEKDFACVSYSFSGVNECECTDCGVTSGPEVMSVTLKNVYPFYSPTVTFGVTNIGTIPVHIVGHWIIEGPVGVDPLDESTWIYVPKCQPYTMDLNNDGMPDVSIGLSGPAEPQQIHPCETEMYGLYYYIHQEYPQCNTLEFKIKLRAMQWNLEP